MRRYVYACCALLSLATTLTAQTYKDSELITTDKLKAHLTYIASDLLEGRDTPSRGLDLAAAYIAANLAQWGVKPAGDNGSYFQKIPLYLNKINPNETYCEIAGARFPFGEFIESYLTADGTISAEAVYVQHGWIFPKLGIDPYAGVDVKGKIVIAHGGYPPKGLDPNNVAGKKGADFIMPYEAAKTRGALAVVYVPGMYVATNWREFERRSTENGNPSLEKNAMIAINAGPKLLQAIFAGEKHSASEIIGAGLLGKYTESFVFTSGKKITIKVSFQPGMGSTQNVVGLIEGTDLKNEYVAIGAHYDHLGIGAEVNGDKIYNGADDDGSGTVSVLAIAETFAKGQKPKRSILFVWHAGEEIGVCLGSYYYTSHPTVPIDKIVAQLNIDMVGRSKKAGDPGNPVLTGPHELYLIGSKAMSSDLEKISERVNNSFLKLSFNYKYDDVRDPERFFTRSDHYHYAQKGIPIIFYYAGGHDDYHEPSDSIEKIDFIKIQKIARTVYATAWEIGNASTRLKVDRTLPDEWQLAK